MARLALPPGDETLGETMTGVLEAISERLAHAGNRNTWLCGACGCLCFTGETCPKCRHDLFTRTERSHR